MIPHVFLAVFVAVALGLNHPVSAQDVPDSIAAANAAIMESYERGNIVEATDLAVSTLAQAAATLGAEHPDTLTSVDNLALLYQSMGRYADSERLHRRALDARERVLGPEHPDTLTSIDNLGLLYASIGRYSEAEAFHRSALEARKRVLGTEASDTVDSVNNLAVLYDSMGRFAEAEPLYRQALETSERVLGPGHPYTLISIANLAALYANTGRSLDAERLYRRALVASERALGPDHPETILSIEDLANFYQANGRYVEAEPLYLDTLETQKRELGFEHPDTLTSFNNLALLYQKMGRYTEAEPLYDRAIEVQERVLGPEHIDTLLSIGNLALLYHVTGRHSKAEPLYRRTLETRERLLGPENLDTLNSVSNLATLYDSMGRYREAEQLYRQALEARERVLGLEHRDTLTSIDGLANLYESTGRYAEAEVLHRRTLKIRERVLGSEHPETLASINNLAGLYESTRRYAEAEPLYLRALEIKIRVLGPEHPDTLISLNNLATLYDSTERLAEAEQLLRQGLEAQERVLGAEHPDTLASVNNLASVYTRAGRFEDAESLYRRVLETSERVLGKEHLRMFASVANLAALYASTGRLAEAEPLYRDALEAQERILGAEHPDTISTLGKLAILLVRTDRSDEALVALRSLDLRLGQWLDTEVVATRAAARRRQIITLESKFQALSFSLALQYPSEASVHFAADLALKWKKRLAQDEALLGNIARERDEPEFLEAIAAVRSGRRALSNIAFDENATPSDRTRLREALEEAEAGLRAQSDRFRDYLSAKAANAETVRLALQDDAALIEYRFFEPFNFDDATYDPLRLIALVMRADAAPALVDLGEAQVFFALYAGVVDADLRQAKNVGFTDLMHFGSQHLINPLLPHLSGIDSLYIAPDGPLQAVPFEAFEDDNGSHLIQRFEVHMMQTGRDLVGRGHRPGGKGLVALGGIDFGETAVAIVAAPLQPPTEIRAALDATRAQFAGFPPLAATLAEVTYIGDAYAAYRPGEPTPIVLTGRDATEAAVKSLALPPRTLHFATHGFYLASGTIEGRPLLQSGITLAGANQALRGATGPDDENGVLHAVEVQTLNLFGTELVVLSACVTGQGAIDYSEGLEGLPRAFFVAGAQNVLAALWSVGDTAALNFMQRFYENWLAQEISNPSAALRQAKLWYIGQTDERLADPQNWAPFVLFEG